MITESFMETVKQTLTEGSGLTVAAIQAVMKKHLDPKLFEFSDVYMQGDDVFYISFDGEETWFPKKTELKALNRDLMALGKKHGFTLEIYEAGDSTRVKGYVFFD